MEITVKLGGQLLPGVPRSQQLTFKRRMIAVLDVMARLDLEPDEIGLIVVNGVQSEPEDPIDTDSRVSFFPYMSGG